MHAVFVTTRRGVVIRIHPGARLPRTFRRFCGLMGQLLQKLQIRATNGAERLLRVVKGPVGRLLPAGATRVGFSSKAEVVRMDDWVRDGVVDGPGGKGAVFVLGAFAHGAISETTVDVRLGVSRYPLSAACAVGRICNALERKWDIV